MINFTRNGGVFLIALYLSIRLNPFESVSILHSL
jgi:hypothetical protein